MKYVSNYFIGNLKQFDCHMYAFIMGSYKNKKVYFPLTLPNRL